MRHKRRLSSFHFVFSIALVGVLVSLGLSFNAPRAVTAFQGNLLQNPGFEGSFPALNGDDTLRVAANWQPWSVSGGSSSAENARPEYKPAPANRIHSGQSAQEYNTFYATHTGGVYQRVPVTPGAELRFSIFVYVWSSAPWNNPDQSVDPNDVQVRVGIDPLGGTDGQSSNIVWSADSEFYDEWRELSVTATAQGSTVTVFVRSAPGGDVGANNIYVDDATLLALGQTVPTTAPTNTFVPTNTFMPSDTPDFGVPTQEGTMTPVATVPGVPTLTPSFTPSATPSLPGGYTSSFLYTVQSGDTVSGIAARYGSTIDAIVVVNDLVNPGLIRVGQMLVVPIRPSPNQPATLTPMPTQASVATATPHTGTGGPTVPGTTTYAVRRGDTLYALSARFNTSVAALAQLNNIINPHLIFAGQVLIVPQNVYVPQQPVPQQPLQHVVQPGENLFRIGLRYNVLLDALARTNNIYNWNLIFPGQVLVIPQ